MQKRGGMSRSIREEGFQPTKSRIHVICILYTTDLNSIYPAKKRYTETSGEIKKSKFNAYETSSGSSMRKVARNDRNLCDKSVNIDRKEPIVNYQTRYHGSEASAEQDLL